MNPRRECGCQPVALSSSVVVAPSGRFSISKIVAVLLPSRAPAAFFAPLGVFLARVAALAGGAALAGLPFLGATLPARFATLAVFAPLGWSPTAWAWAVSISSMVF